MGKALRLLARPILALDLLDSLGGEHERGTILGYTVQVPLRFVFEPCPIEAVIVEPRSLYNSVSVNAHSGLTVGRLISAAQEPVIMRTLVLLDSFGSKRKRGVILGDAVHVP